LYKYYHGETWTNSNHWHCDKEAQTQDDYHESDSSLDDWYGVQVNLNNEVVALKLKDNNLIGNLYF
jgi:hypothetical protein